MTGPHDTVTTANISTSENGDIADTSPASTTTTNPQLPHENAESADGRMRRGGKQRGTLKI